MVIKSIRLFFRKRKIKKAIKEAVELTRADGRKRIILNVPGSPHMYTKQYLQRLIRKRCFHKGVTIQELEANALFITK
ncbi:MAG: hypothetical protein LBU37_01685 [Tannerellaceae bacterium]|jgi:hypothetical protein|nr:hypothetical protein [Tannerellaceae bacterium]